MVRLYLAWSPLLARRWSSGSFGWLPIKIGASSNHVERLKALREGFVKDGERGAPLAACTDWQLVDLCGFSNLKRAEHAEEALRNRLLCSKDAAAELVMASTRMMKAPSFKESIWRSNGVGELRLTGRSGMAHRVTPLVEINPPFEALVINASNVLDVACAVMRRRLRSQRELSQAA